MLVVAVGAPEQGVTIMEVQQYVPLYKEFAASPEHRTHKLAHDPSVRRKAAKRLTAPSHVLRRLM